MAAATAADDLQQQLEVVQSREAAAQDAAAQREQELAQMRGRLDSAEAEKVGPRQVAVDKGSLALRPEDLHYERQRTGRERRVP